MIIESLAVAASEVASTVTGETVADEIATNGAEVGPSAADIGKVFSPDKRLDAGSEIKYAAQEKEFDPDKRIVSNTEEKDDLLSDTKMDEATTELDSFSSSEIDRHELIDEEREIIKNETGWSDEIVDHIKNKEQYEIYKEAGLEEMYINGRPCLIKKELDLDYVSEKTIDDEHPQGMSNRELMAEGKSPYDSKTGEKIELHHMGQDYDSPFAELCENSEHGDGNDKILHDKDKPSWRNNPDLKFNYNNMDKPDHWKERSKG